VTLTSLPVALPQDSAQRKRLSDVAGEFEEAAALPGMAPEARVHQAHLLWELGDAARALDVLDRIGTTDDPYVEYWGTLFRGLALQGLNRVDDAIATYEHAAALYPGAQTPAVALVPLLVKANRLDDALRWSAIARTRASAALDPWWQYRSSGARLVPEWIRELRAAGRSSL
jgi:hypothetical protein